MLRPGGAANRASLRNLAALASCRCKSCLETSLSKIRHKVRKKTNGPCDGAREIIAELQKCEKKLSWFALVVQSDLQQKSRQRRICDHQGFSTSGVTTVRKTLFAC